MFLYLAIFVLYVHALFGVCNNDRSFLHHITMESPKSFSHDKSHSSVDNGYLIHKVYETRIWNWKWIKLFCITVTVANETLFKCNIFWNNNISIFIPALDYCFHILVPWICSNAITNVNDEEETCQLSKNTETLQQRPAHTIQYRQHTKTKNKRYISQQTNHQIEHWTQKHTNKCQQTLNTDSKFSSRHTYFEYIFNKQCYYFCYWFCRN